MDFDLLADKFNDACNMKDRHAGNNLIKELTKIGACNFPKDSTSRLIWFKEALNNPTKKWFALQIIEKVHPIPKSLFNDLVLASLLEPNVSSNKRYIMPCVKTFGLSAVQAKIREYSTHEGVVANDGVKNIQYWLNSSNV